MIFYNETSLSGSQKAFLFVFVGLIIVSTWLFLRAEVHASDWFLMAFVWIGRNSYAASGFLESPSKGKLEWFLGPLAVGFVCSIALIIRFSGNSKEITAGMSRPATFSW